jgi:hypothetical protein
MILHHSNSNLDDLSVASVDAIDTITSAMFRKDLLAVVQRAVACAPVEVQQAAMATADYLSLNCTILSNDCQRSLLMEDKCDDRTLDPVHELVLTGSCFDTPTNDESSTISAASSMRRSSMTKNTDDARSCPSEEDEDEDDDDVSSKGSSTVEVTYDGATETIVTASAINHAAIVEVKPQPPPSQQESSSPAAPAPTAPQQPQPQLQPRPTNNVALKYRHRLPQQQQQQQRLDPKSPASFYTQGSILENGPSARRLRKFRQLSRRSMMASI